MTTDVPSQDWYRSAVAFVRQRHAGKRDALGAPYHLHFERVAARLLRLFPTATRGQIEAALLHDALEPGDGKIADLGALGLDPEAVRIIAAITLPQDGRSYVQYIADLAATGDVPSVQVKLADNLDATEFYSSRPSLEARAVLRDRYDPCRLLLQAALIRAEHPAVTASELG